jgi:hypothetical protein
MELGDTLSIAEPQRRSFVFNNSHYAPVGRGGGRCEGSRSLNCSMIIRYLVIWVFVQNNKASNQIRNHEEIIFHGWAKTKGEDDVKDWQKR